ncbi:hypothetical protein [Streptomyces sp. LUP47B]|uniref:hypothetical protein n=1 Tax=Streptomyces sp. LUP47B TaxID=1890286 RepID=UPI0008518210|nr:hypothetical protein [Streptomyces sp. LUP47B]
MITFNADTGKAQNAVAVARRRNLGVPAEIDQVAGMWQVAVDASHMKTPERPTVDDIPATAEELRTLIADRAHAHRVALAHNQVGTDFLEPIARRYNTLVRDHVDGWIRALQPDFLALIKVLAKQEKKLPANLDQQHIDLRNPAISAPWETASNAAVKLDQLVNDRQILARASGQDLGRDAELWAVAEITAPSSEDVFAHKLRDEVGPALREWRDLKATPIARWLYLSRSPHFTLQLATPGEVTQRQSTMERWQQAVAVVMGSGLSHQQAQHAVATALRG